MHLVIFEDERWTRFAPASLSRPLFSLFCGTSTLLDKLIRDLKPDRLSLWVRPELITYCKQHVLPKLTVPTQINVPLNEEPALLVSAATLSSETCEWPAPSTVSLDRDLISSVCAVSPGLSPADVLDLTARWQDMAGYQSMRPIGRVACYLWDLITWNEQAIIGDAAHLRPPSRVADGPYHVVHPEAIHLGSNVRLGPGCVIDAARGPVILSGGVTISANAVITGPCFIGEGSTISPLASIRGGTSVGNLCKIGGEVSNAIFMSCSNKAHEGFVGDSYIGEWVNFGAGASTSNLKNTYGEISLRIGRQIIPTGRKFLGALVGDHSKFAIATRLMTGSYIGYCCMVAASVLTPTFLPSFTFYTDRGSERYARDKARETMTSVFKRRSREWHPSDDAMLDAAAALSEKIEII